MAGQANVLFGWSHDDFWSNTPSDFVAAKRAYLEIFCRNSAFEKRRRFTLFKREVEAADQERRRQKRAAGR